MFTLTIDDDYANGVRLKVSELQPPTGLLFIPQVRDGQTFLWAGQMKKVKCQVGQLNLL
jgi:hypothetical protein